MIKQALAQIKEGALFALHVFLFSGTFMIVFFGLLAAIATFLYLVAKVFA